MAEIVLVHGIGQQYQTPDALERDWIPAIAGGLRIAGHADYADRLWRGARPGDLEIRMAFYGDHFRRADQQGDTMTEDVSEPAGEVAAALLAELAQRAATRVTDHRDREHGRRALAALQDSPDEQGPRSGVRAALTALARIRPLAKLGMTVADTMLRTTLRQVSRYLTDDTLREQVQARVAEHLGPGTLVVIGHSLGSVVAYEAAHRNPWPLPALITLGSPLGLRNVVYERTRPQPPAVPPRVRRWVNVADRDDIVAATLDLTTRFPGAGSVLEHTYTVDNGAHPHDATFYLSTRTVANTIAHALGAMPAA